MKATVFTAFGAFGAGELQPAERARARASKQMGLCVLELFMAEVSSGKNLLAVRC
jgi:hypothetical protein